MRTSSLKPILAAGVLAALLVAVTAQAHHGWGGYDTGKPLYLEGIVAEVRWRNPHPEVVIEVAATPPAKKDVAVPQELAALGFGEVAAKAAPPAQGGRYTLDLAPIGRLAAWGMASAPTTGQPMTAIAFPSCTEAGTVRPALIVLADGTAVRQQSVALPAGCSGAPRG
jgi:hypothetical protein